jgi:hypothetical protein
MARNHPKKRNHSTTSSRDERQEKRGKPGGSNSSSKATQGEGKQGSTRKDGSTVGSNKKSNNKNSYMDSAVESAVGPRTDRTGTSIPTTAGTTIGPPSTTYVGTGRSTGGGTLTPMSQPGTKKGNVSNATSQLQSAATTTPQSSKPIPVSIHGNHGGGVEDNASVITSLTNSQAQASAMFQPRERDLKKEEKDRKAALIEYVRHQLFPRWKFFTHKKQTEYSALFGGIVYKICNDMHVRAECKEKWWKENSHVIVQALNGKRADVTTYLKKVFIGTLMVVVLTPL